MVLRHKKKLPPSENWKGDIVLFKMKKSSSKNRENKVEHEVDKGIRYAGFHVSMITSGNWAEEIKWMEKAK